MISQESLVPTGLKALDISSEAFENQSDLPVKYTCDGENINPPLAINNIPHDTKSLVLIIDDPDAPIRTWVNWIVWNIPPTQKIKENSVPGIEGWNDFRNQNYVGPCPLSGVNRYFFKVYALNQLLDLKPVATKRELEKAMSPHVIAFGQMVGRYKRPLLENH
jgi:hypothetical protein